MEDENEGFMEAAAKLLDPLEHELRQGWLTAQTPHVIFQKKMIETSLLLMSQYLFGL